MHTKIQKTYLKNKIVESYFKNSCKADIVWLSLVDGVIHFTVTHLRLIFSDFTLLEIQRTNPYS